MALKYYTGTTGGNWSTAANWSTGTKPQAGDEAILHGKTVIADEDITCTTIGTYATGAALAGGTLTVNTARTINANITVGTTTVVTDSHTSWTVTINGNILASNVNAAYGVLFTGSAPLTIVGSVIGGSGNVNSNGIRVSTGTGAISITGLVYAGSIGYGVLIEASCAVTITGDQVVRGANTNVYSTVSGATINVIGNISGSLAASNPTAVSYISNAGTVNVTGNVLMRDTACTNGLIYHNSTLNCTITGNVTGGSVANAYAINNVTTGNVIITGTATGGSHATNTPAVTSTTAGIIEVDGNCQAGTYPAIFSSSATSILKCLGNITFVLGVSPWILSPIGLLKCSPSNGQLITFIDTANASRSLGTGNANAGNPTPANTRSGVVYGPASEFTGTMIVPSPASVSKNVPTDNTVGTAVVSPEDFWNLALASITTGIGLKAKSMLTHQAAGVIIQSLQK